MAHRRIWPAWQYVAAFLLVVVVLNRPLEKSADDFVQWCVTVLPAIMAASVILYVIKSHMNKRLRNHSDQGEPNG